MVPMALPLILLGAALAQGPHPQGVEKIVLDMNVEVTSLLGQKLYRAPAEGDELKTLEATLAENEKKAEAQPDDLGVHVERAQALGMLWRYHDAVQAYTKAISLAPTDGTLFARRGNVFVILRQFEQATNDFQHATTLAPANSAGWKGLGIAHYLMRNFEDAEKAIAEALRLETVDHVENAYIDQWAEIIDIRLGQPQAPNTMRRSGILSYIDPSRERYLAGLKTLLAGDKVAAVAEWRDLVSSEPNWANLNVVAAEAEIAAIEGSKKMKAATF